MFTKSLTAAALGCAMLCLSSGAAVAGEPKVSEVAATTAVTPELNTQQGMKAYIDPATGEFTAPSVQPRAITQNGPTGLRQIPGAFGGTQVHLQGQYRAYSVGRRDASGKVQVDCFDGSEGAAKAAAATGEEAGR